jgi:hypothetical protein
MLETKIEALTQAVIALTEVILKIEAKETVEPVAAPVAAPVIVTYTPEDQAVAKEIIEAIDKTVMPAAPTFDPVVEAPAGAKAPFTDGKGLIDYVMTAYKEMGAEKGAKIQGVLSEMGLQNVNELRPTEYDAFYAKVEALK